jgi:monoterpene epsilon-lactone hydrolase
MDPPSTQNRRTIMKNAPFTPEHAKAAWSESRPASAEDTAVLTALRPLLEPFKGRLQGTAARPAFDDIMGHTPDADGVEYETGTVAGVPGWWCRPRTPRDGDEAILHLHGGWYVWGSAIAYRKFTGHIAARTRTAAFVADYRLAPEHPFPAGLEDAQKLYAGLVERGFRRIALVGDSAGGGLALALLSLLAKDAPGGVKAAAAVLLSPVTDLTLSGASWETRDATDPYFTRGQAAELIGLYLNGHAPTDPLASPLFGNVAGLPPIRVHVGDAEMLLDDSLRYIERAVAAGVDARVDVWESMLHVFPSGIGRFGAATLALDEIGAFLADRLAA